ncbi:hypothetical protein F8388_008609 [Cannabis sativa]|uniref:Adenosine deaminase domain-containing protein n=1 Tax=Cannabis sativa TaxID=3483 RepID=A0A7J6FPA6_CANSA|nr:hypothetical protein F8388_008609 [Cannabis sativa]
MHSEIVTLSLVEICLTSNIRTNTISSLDVHHFGWLILYVDAAELYEEKHPLSLCTDDVGVFSTSLSGEYKLAASAFDLGKKELSQLAKNDENYMNHRPANMNFLLCLRLFWHFCTYRFLN